MDRAHPLTRSILPVGVAACLAAAGCGGASGGQQTVRPASDERPAAEATQRAGDEKQGERHGRDGRDGASAHSEGGSSSQSSSITQSSEGGSSSNQSNSIVQRSDSGSSSSSSQSISGNGGVQTLSGTGETTVSFGVDEPSRLSWTNSRGKRFSVQGDGISIDSRAGRGEIDLSPGRYNDVRVRGASWTIVIRPR